MWFRFRSIFVIFFVCAISSELISQSPLEPPLVIVKRGDVAPGSILDGNTADLIFESVSPPVITEDGRRAAFAANLSSDLTMPQSVKSYWFADLKEDDFYDLTLAAISGMEVEGSDMVLDLDWINTGNGFESPRNIAQIALDTVTGKLAFVAGLVAKENPGEPETALFIADTTGIELVTKQGPSGIKTQPQFEGDVPIDIDVGFQEIKFVNDRLVFNSSVTNPTTFIQSTGIAVYENRELTYPIISAVGIPSSFFDSQVNQEVTIERTGQVATNANGAIVYTLSGRVPNAPACTFNNRNVELLRYRSPGEEAFTTISKNWNTLPEGSGFFEDTFISGFREISLNADNDVVAIASLGEFVGEQTQDCPLGTPDFPTNKSAIILFETVDQTPTESVIVATADMAEGYEGVGSNIINRLDSLQMAGSYVSYYAYFPGDPINFGSTIALYRTHLDFEGPGELIFHLAGPSHVEGLGTIDLIIHSLLGPNGDMVVQLITNDRSRRGLVYVSPPDEEGNSEYTLLASSSSNQNFLCEVDCNSFPPELAALGFIPGGNVLGPSLGPEAGYGTWINTYQAGWMLTNDMFSSNRREYSVLFKFGEPPVIEEPTFPQPPGLTLDGSSDTAYQISLKNIEEKDYEIWESNDLNLWSFLAKLSETPGSPLPAQVSVPKPLVDSTFWDLRNVSPPPVEALPAITTSSGIQNAFLHTGNAGEPILSSAVASYGAAAAGAGLNVFSQSPSLIAPALVGIQVGLNAGEMNVEKTDLTIQGVGNIHFKMTRSYRSQLAYDGPLGYGWDFRYNERLFIQENGDAHHLNGQGGLLIWISTSPSTFKSPTGHFGTLRKNTDGSFSSRDPDGFKHHFTDQGRLSSLEDCWGNTLTLTYDQRGNIQHIFDPYGRRIDFGYAPVAGVDRLQQVRDYTGRTLVYNYNQKGNLTEVTGPKIVGSLNGNDFPFGRTELYTYKSDIANAQLDHNLLTITLPEQVAQADPPNVVVQYGEDSNNPDSLDKVVSIKMGGSDSGGTATISYEAVNQAAGPDPNVSRMDITIVDANNQTTLYQINEAGNRIREERFTSGIRPGDPVSYKTDYEYDDDRQLKRVKLPLGNERRYTYHANGTRAQQANLLEERWVADETRGGRDRIRTWTYEPLNQGVLSESDPRENDDTFVPHIGEKFAGRYVRNWRYAYQENEDSVPEADDWEINLSGISRGLGDQNGDGVTNQVFAKAIRIEGPSLTLEEGSNLANQMQAASIPVIREFQYDSRGNVTRHRDTDGNVTDYRYYPENDPEGDGSTIPGQNSTFGRGYLKSEVKDAVSSNRRFSAEEPQALKTEYAYDRYGNRSMERNPRGVERTFKYNAVGELVVETRGSGISAAISRGELPESDSPLDFERRFSYDGNGNRTQIETENDPGEAGAEGVGQWIEQRFTYNGSGNQTSESREINATQNAHIQRVYDNTGRLTEESRPEGGITRRTYDERGRIYEVKFGAGTGDEGTYQYGYDNNGNRSAFVTAEDKDKSGQREITEYSYDGHDQRVSTHLPNRTEVRVQRDPAGNVTEEQVLGHPGNNPDGAIELLSSKKFIKDELNRTYKIDQDLFVVPGVALVRDPELPADKISVAFERLPSGLVAFYVGPSGSTNEYAYYGSGRLRRRRDGLGNAVVINYDPNGNPTTVEQVDVAQDLSNDSLTPANQSRFNYYSYDQLDRPIRSSNARGNTVRREYDYRGNLIAETDARGVKIDDPSGEFQETNNDGNRNEYRYDGANRKVAQSIHYTVGGTSDGERDTSNPHYEDGVVTENYTYDRNDNLSTFEDGNGNLTEYAYDSRDRLKRLMRGNGSNVEYTYDRDSNRVVEENDDLYRIERSFNSTGHLVEETATLATGAIGTTQKTWSYDGFGNTTGTTDNGSNYSTTRVFDSGGQILEEVRGPRQAVTSYNYSSSGRVIQQTNPDETRIRYTLDALERENSVTKTVNGLDPQVIIEGISYYGAADRELERLLGNGQSIRRHDTLGAITGFDETGTEIGFSVADPNQNVVIERAYHYDPNYNLISLERFDQDNQTDFRDYDSANKIILEALDQNGQNGESARDGLTSTFLYDGPGNRRSVTSDTNSNEPMVLDYTPDELNNYSMIGSTSRSHDTKGNLTNDGNFKYIYDAWNRIVEVRNQVDQLVAEYRYDAFDNQVGRSIYDENQALVSDTEFYVDQQGQTISSFDLTEQDYQTFFIYKKGELVYKEDADEGETWFINNVENNIIATADTSGEVTQKILYDAFRNQTRTEDQPGAPQQLYPSSYLDPVTNLYRLNGRNFDSTIGKFVNREPSSPSNVPELDPGRPRPIHPTHQVDSQTAAGGPTIAPSAEMLKNSNTAVEQKLVLTDLIHPDIDPQMRSTRPIPFLTPRSLQTPDTIPLDRFGPGTGRVSTDPITGQEFPSTNEDWNLRNAAAMFLSILFVPAENDWVVLQEILRTPDIELNDRADGLLDRQAQFGNPPAANQDSSKSVESILKEFDPTLVVL